MTLNVKIFKIKGNFYIKGCNNAPIGGRPFDSEGREGAGKFGLDRLFIFSMSSTGNLFSGIPRLEYLFSSVIKF